MSTLIFPLCSCRLPGGRSAPRGRPRARRLNGPPAFTTPLATGSPWTRSAGRTSLVGADSSRTATPVATVPSTGITSPSATSTMSPAAISSSGTTSTRSPRDRRAVRGARSSSALRSCLARSAAHASRVRPLVSMKLITAAASSSRTATAPASASSARSRPRRGGRGGCSRRRTTARSPRRKHPLLARPHPRPRLHRPARPRLPLPGQRPSRSAAEPPSAGSARQPHGRRRSSPCPRACPPLTGKHLDKRHRPGDVHHSLPAFLPWARSSRKASRGHSRTTVAASAWNSAGTSRGKITGNPSHRGG